MNEEKTIPKVFKHCQTCGVYFPSKLKIFNSYCPEHQDDFNNTIERIKHDRYVDASLYDVFNDIPYIPVKYNKNEKDSTWYVDYCKSRPQSSYKLFERVCRICGSRLLSKKGNYMPTRRYCSTCNQDETVNKFFYNWDSTRNNYRYNLWIKQGQPYIYTYESSEYYKASIPCTKDVIKCEDCGKDVLYHEITVHHKIEVNQLTADNILLLWDFDNILALCWDCHYKKRHGWKNPDERKLFTDKQKIESIRKKHVPLDKFI